MRHQTEVEPRLLGPTFVKYLAGEHIDRHSVDHARNVLAKSFDPASAIVGSG